MLKFEELFTSSYPNLPEQIDELFTCCITDAENIELSQLPNDEE